MREPITRLITRSLAAQQGSWILKERVIDVAWQVKKAMECLGSLPEVGVLFLVVSRNLLAANSPVQL